MEPLNFKNFILSEASSIDASIDTKKTIKKLPKEHQLLLKGYKISFESGCSLKNDKNHIGYNDLNKRKIVVSGPWHYGREFTLLHEIGHLIWFHYMKNDKAKQATWKALVKATPNKVDQQAEEVFCHTYANLYSKHKMISHNQKKNKKFVKSI